MWVVYGLAIVGGVTVCLGAAVAVGMLTGALDSTIDRTFR